MKSVKLLRTLALAAAALGGASCLIAPADAATRLGTLNCNVSGGVGFVITSSRALSCIYEGAGGRQEYYTGTVQRFGLDIGFTGPGKLGWVVFAASRPGPGALAGQYAGASAALSVGAGVGANALIGGFNNSVTLQPVSVEVQSGVNIAAGVGAMTLDWIRPTVRRVRRR